MSIGPKLRKLWAAMSGKPGGKYLFSRLLGRFVRYSGSVRADIDTLEPGHSVIYMKDRKKIHNHLHSIHAVALANLGELSTGLALLNSLPDQTRAILVGLNIEYTKKARGRLKAECFCDVPQSNTEAEVVIQTEIRDLDGDVVAKVQASWKMGPEKNV